MKKLMIAALVAVSFAACSENTSKETTGTEENKTAPAADSREKEIADSTKMLDKKLADPNDPTTPDSLK